MDARRATQAVYQHAGWVHGASFPRCRFTRDALEACLVVICACSVVAAVSYTHLTLPTICSV
eukprot:2730837-Alexandrium_andersonii.AAC.1